MNINDYQELGSTGSAIQKQRVAPEDEFFHSIYIPGKPRKNESGVQETPGKLQIRGFRYNLDKVCMIITHIKNVLVKSKQSDRGVEKTECSSFCPVDSPWRGTSGKVCPRTSADRSSVDFCRDCRSRLIVAGVITDEKGNPQKSKNGGLVYGFIVGKGTKYAKVSDYINELTKLDLTPVFTPVTEQTKAFEKSTVNSKRFVTIIEWGEGRSSFGTTTIFELSRGVQIADATIPKILSISKETYPKFVEKFDWSKGQTQHQPQDDGANSYSESAPVSGGFDSPSPTTAPSAEPEFDDIPAF